MMPLFSLFVQEKRNNTKIRDQINFMVFSQITSEILSTSSLKDIMIFAYNGGTGA
jgi:hypothetical protein